jgi:hypothetical protein
MKYLINLFKNSKNNQGQKKKPFFELSDKEKDEIIIKSAKQANQDQKDLVEKYQRIYSQRS